MNKKLFFLLYPKSLNIYITRGYYALAALYLENVETEQAMREAQEAEQSFAQKSEMIQRSENTIY